MIKENLNSKSRQNSILAYPFFMLTSFTSYSLMKFPKLSSGYDESFTKKLVSDDVKISAIKTNRLKVNNRISTNLQDYSN